MQANDSPNLLLSDVLQRKLLGRVQAYFDTAVARVFLSEGEQSVDRGLWVCWVDLNLQIFCSQDFV